MRYGVPYKGSKSGISKKLIEALPSASTFIDLFAGGCAMTHAAMLSGKYGRFVVNDICDEGIRLFEGAIHGEYANEKRWISRDVFERLKTSDPFVSICWSFGNNQRNYMYSREIEPYKRAYHFAYFFGDYGPARALGLGDVLDGIYEVTKHERYNVMRRRLRSFWTDRTFLSKDAHGSGMVQLSLERLERLESLERLQSLQSLESLERLQSLQSLQSLESLERLERLNLSYDDVPIQSDAIIYCDPPYANTNGYDKTSLKTTFDSARFWGWVRDHNHQAIVSEYSAPPDFTPILSVPKRNIMCSQCNKAVVEHLFVHRESNLLNSGLNSLFK